ncbi:MULTISPECIES: TetR family transcriptional regulator [Amycolatopsis]|uniref:TetR/AcrR family transcriptional regulator n=1 Tax=Amycolatopsis eburnea TaxID=2267691 RepID=A0A427SZS4_9PSEU|nr:MULTISPECIES: TetR family transcriptional regulator [Amycolatopsis]NBH08071.1 TetR family transcriptional regulator [Amycolatopsis sp. SID8362]NED44765.1 TetR/AcrR family transcriptional regulator [Amycolatopsis sp. SID8362]RSD10653.1 TetR/AcrR family transcriptional regulator [Amycolatopsis eburnea]
MKAVTHPAPARTRERLLAAAADVIAADGWAAVTMGKLAARVGVSRQTVYNELGSKAELAEALMLAETDLFVARVNADVAAHPDDPVDGVTAAFRHTLEAARANPLVQIALGGAQGGRDDFLPLLTSQPEAVLGRAVEAVAAVFAGAYPQVRLTPSEWAVAVEAFVRLLLSHLVQPSGSAEHASGQMRWVIGRMLGS